MATAERQRFDGFAVALWFLSAGVVCLWGASFFDATGSGRVAWFVAAALLGEVGLAGGLIELEKLYGKGGGAEIAVTVVCMGLAGILYLVYDRGVVGGLGATLTKVVVFLLVLIAPAGVCFGLARWFAALTDRSEPKPQSSRIRKSSVLPALTACVGLATTVVGFVQALRSP